MVAENGPCLRRFGPYGKDRRIRGRISSIHPARRCRSSVVEHSLGKGEVVSSILTGSTRKSPINKGLSHTRENALGKIVQNKARLDAPKRTKSAPSVRQTFTLREGDEAEEEWGR